MDFSGNDTGLEISSEILTFCSTTLGKMLKIYVQEFSILLRCSKDVKV